MGEEGKQLQAIKVVSVDEEDDKHDNSRALAIVDNPGTLQIASTGSIERDGVLARLQTDKRMSMIKAWEDSEKTKAVNKSQKKMSTISSWEKSKTADVEADLKKTEETFEKKKAEYAEKMRNKIAMIHKAAEEKRAMVEVTRGETLLKVEEMAARYRATGMSPKKTVGCFGA